MKKQSPLLTFYSTRHASLNSLDIKNDSELAFNELESADLIRKLQAFERQSIDFQKRLKSHAKKHIFSKEMDLPFNYKGNDTTAASELSTSPTHRRNDKIEEKNDKKKSTRAKSKSNAFFNFNFQPQPDSLTKRAMNIQDHKDPAIKRFRTKSEATFTATSASSQNLPPINIKEEGINTPKIPLKASDLALDATKVLNILRRKTARNKSYLLMKPSNSPKLKKIQNKVENEVQNFVRKHFTEDTKGRIQTFEKFSFNHSERDDNRVVLTILNELKHPREPTGSVFVTDLWSKNQQRECMEKSAFGKEKKLVEKYLYYKTKDKTALKRRESKPTLIISSKDEECYKNMVEMNQNSIEHQASVMKRDSKLIVITPVKLTTPDHMKKKEENKLQGIFDAIIKLNTENSKDLKNLGKYATSGDWRLKTSI